MVMYIIAGIEDERVSQAMNEAQDRKRSVTDRGKVSLTYKVSVQNLEQ